jgi:hypothetical protein
MVFGCYGMLLVCYAIAYGMMGSSYPWRRKDCLPSFISYQYWKIPDRIYWLRCPQCRHSTFLICMDYGNIMKCYVVNRNSNCLTCLFYLRLRFLLNAQAFLVIFAPYFLQYSFGYPISKKFFNASEKYNGVALLVKIWGSARNDYYG